MAQVLLNRRSGHIAEKDALAALLAGLEMEDAAVARMLAELADHQGIRRSVIGDPDGGTPVPDEEDRPRRAPH